MSLNRRHALASGAALLLTSSGRNCLATVTEPGALAALDQSPLVYLSPLVSHGRESRCHAEVWFVQRQREIFVVTWVDKWRAEAMRRGFRRARIWIGDFGPWRSAGGRYLSAPSLEIEGRFETDPGTHAELLGAFASKYKREWGAWDQRVRDGLASGAWVLLRYQIAA